MQDQPDDQKIERTLARSRWLADLSAALDQAYRLALLLAARNSDSREAIILRTCIQAARAEVEALRLSSPSWLPGDIAPNRIGSCLWKIPPPPPQG